METTKWLLEQAAERGAVLQWCLAQSDARMPAGGRQRLQRARARLEESITGGTQGCHVDIPFWASADDCS